MSAPEAQFTPKTVETATERQKLAFRVKVQIDPELLRKYEPQVKTGLPGIAYVRLDAKADWPAKLQVTLSAVMQPATVVARLSDVALRYGHTVALDDVDLEIPAGCVVGLDRAGWGGQVQPPGAHLRRAQDPTRAACEVLGGTWPTRATAATVCPRIAYMPQGLGKNLYPTLSVAENLEFFARLFGQPRAEREWRMRRAVAQHRPGTVP